MTIIYNKGTWIENNFLQNSEKEIKSLLLKKSKLNLKLLYLVMKLNTFIILQPWVYNIQYTKKGLHNKPIGAIQKVRHFGRGRRVQGKYDKVWHGEEVSLHNQSECGKKRTRITPNTDTFYAVLAKYDGE